MSQPSKTTSTKPTAESHSGGLLDEDHLHVPKGIPRWQFLTLVALMIVMLIIFIVPSTSLPGTGRGGGDDRNPVAASWNRPGHGRVEWREADLLTTMRALGNALRIDQFLGMQAGINPQRPEREDFIRLMVLDQLALDAGIRITDADLASHIRGLLEFSKGTDQDWIRIVRDSGYDQRSIEESLRRVLRAVRFTQMVAFAGAVPDPAKVEELWHRDHVEYAFDYTSVDVASMREQALEELPDDTGLEAWFNALSDPQKEEFKTAERRTAELVRFRDAATHPAEALLQDFPEPVAEGAEATPIEELAQRYYDRVYFKRFARRELGVEPVPGERPRAWYTREEADRQLVAEAPIYFAMQRWLDSLKKRAAEEGGASIDLQAEAAKYGLEYLRIDNLTQEELGQRTDLGDQDLAGQTFGLESPGDFSYSLFPSGEDLCFVRLSSLTTREMPPFGEIREAAVEKWLQPHMNESALGRLRKIREGLEAFTPAVEEGAEPVPGKHYRANAEAFRAAVEAAGLMTGHRAWLDKRAPLTSDPQWELAANKFIASMANREGYYELAEDEVAEPSLSTDSKTAYLVRLAGQREVPLENMSPREYEQLKRQSRSSAIAGLGSEMDIAYLEKNFGLELRRSEEREKSAP